MKKIILTVIILIIAGVGFLLLQKPPPHITNAPQPRMEQVTFYHYFSAALKGGIDEMVHAINQREEYHQLVAKPLDHEAFKSMIHTAFNRGNPPQLFSYWAGAKTQQLVEEGHLEPLDDLWEAEALDQRFKGPVITSASTYTGHRYLLPIMQHMVVFFYNRHIFQKFSLSPPTNWPELLQLAAELKRHNITPFALGAKERWPAQFWFDYLLLRTAGSQYREELMQGKRTYTEPEVKRVFTLWADLIQDEFFNSQTDQLDWDQATGRVCDGSAAMTLMGTWAIQYFTGEGCGFKEEKDFDFFIFPMIDDVEEVAVGPVDGIVATRGSTQDVKRMLGYFAEVGPQRLLNAGAGGFAPSSEVADSSYSPLRLRILKKSRNASAWAFNYDLATRIEVADRGLDSFSELFTFPDQADSILKNLQLETAEFFSLQQTKR